MLFNNRISTRNLKNILHSRQANQNSYYRLDFHYSVINTLEVETHMLTYKGNYRVGTRDTEKLS